MQIYHILDEDVNDPFFFDNITTYGSQEEELECLVYFQALEDIEVCDGVMSVDAIENMYDIGDNSDPYDMIELVEESKAYDQDGWSSEPLAYCRAIGW